MDFWSLFKVGQRFSITDKSCTNRCILHDVLSPRHVYYKGFLKSNPPPQWWPSRVSEMHVAHHFLPTSCYGIPLLLSKHASPGYVWFHGWHLFLDHQLVEQVTLPNNSHEFKNLEGRGGEIRITAVNRVKGEINMPNSSPDVLSLWSSSSFDWRAIN